MSGPLAGIKVLELPNIGPMQFAGMALVDLGAEVLRLDRAARRRDGRGTMPARRPFSVLDRNRRCVGVDLKHPDGAEVVLRCASAPTSSSRASGPASRNGSASAPTCAAPATRASSTGA